MNLRFLEVKVTAKGNTGHSLILHENTAAEKLQKVITKMLEVRTKEKLRLESNPDLGLGDVTTINMTMLEVYPISKLQLDHWKERSSDWRCTLFREDFKLTLFPRN